MEKRLHDAHCRLTLKEVREGGIKVYDCASHDEPAYEFPVSITYTYADDTTVTRAWS